MTAKKQYDDTNRGVLFKSDRKDSAKHPDYTGQLNVGGHDYWLSAWIKEGRSGKFMSLSVKMKDGKPNVKQTTTKPNGDGYTIRDDMDDEIPF